MDFHKSSQQVWSVSNVSRIYSLGHVLNRAASYHFGFSVTTRLNDFPWSSFQTLDRVKSELGESTRLSSTSWMIGCFGF